MSVKYICLVVLTIQTVTSALLVRRIRNLQVSIPGIVVAQELLKLLTCICVVIYNEGISRACSMLHTHVIRDWGTTFKMGVPALLYVIQNQLLFMALANLDPATYQITYQLKILTTAVFSIILLRKRISWAQWGSLLMLTTGVILVQWNPSAPDSPVDESSPLLGVSCILIATCTSGFAGVFFELMLKRTEKSSSVWIANIQLALCSCVVALINVTVTEQEHMTKYGLFNEFNSSIVTAVIVSQAYGGLLVGLVVKYADSILKVFATSISIILTAAIGIFYLNELELSAQFGGGMVCVVAATILYALSSKPKTKEE